jgi:ZIP family zinc transporter
MGEALIWGLIAASPLLAGAIIAMSGAPSTRVIGMVTAFGAGALLGAVAFELVLEASETQETAGFVSVGFFTGAAAFTVGSWFLRSPRRAAATTRPDDEEGVEIVLGSVLDGIPESLVLGLSLTTGGSISVAMLISVLVSNLPEGMSSTPSFLRAGTSRTRIVIMWSSVILVSGVAAAVGYLLGDAPPNAVALALAFAGGAVITMVSNTMIPEAYGEYGLLTGPVVAMGFALVFIIHGLE